MLNGGEIKDILATVNFGSAPKGNFELLKKFRPGQPCMCTEYWNGWFDHWYEEHTTQRDSEDILGWLDEFFELGASFNFYMFHGGTNFGFTNGANHSGEHYQPTVTSYDYAAPLTESGDLTPLYFAMRDYIEKKTGIKNPDIKVENSKKSAYGKVELKKSAALFDNLEALSVPVKTAFPKTMEEVGQDFGYILYRTTLRGPFTNLELGAAVRDRAIFFLDGKRIGVKERTRQNDRIILSLKKGEEAVLDILVENMGRNNYGTQLLDKKGIVGGVRFGQQFQTESCERKLPNTAESIERYLASGIFKGIVDRDGV